MSERSLFVLASRVEGIADRIVGPADVEDRHTLQEAAVQLRRWAQQPESAAEWTVTSDERFLGGGVTLTGQAEVVSGMVLVSKARVVELEAQVAELERALRRIKANRGTAEVAADIAHSAERGVS